AAVLGYSPAARLSKTGATTATPRRRAVSDSASVVGPGTGSARSKTAGSSRWQKYCDRKSSGRQTTRAPFPAASSMPATALRRFSAASAVALIWTSPIENFSAFIPAEPTSSPSHGGGGQGGGGASPSPGGTGKDEGNSRSAPIKRDHPEEKERRFVHEQTREDEEKKRIARLFR